MGSTSRDGSYEIKKAMINRLLDDFDHAKVVGLSANPIFTQTINDSTPEPYVYFQEVSSNEEWVTKENESRLHNIEAQVVIRDLPGRGTPQQRDELVNQMIELITDESNYPDPSDAGYRVQRVTTGNIIKYESNERGAKFYLAVVPIEVTAYYHGFDSALPSASASFTFADFTITPQGRNVEAYDSGSVTVGSTYSASNGWNYVSSTVAKITGLSEGTLDGRRLTVSANNNDFGLTTTFNWSLQSDSSQTTTTTDSDRFNRIQSLRYGAIASDNLPTFTDDASDGVGLRLLSNWSGDRRTIDFGNTSPIGDTIEITANAGEWIYIAYGSDVADISGIEEQNGGQNIHDLFNNPVTVGEWKIYVFRQKTNYDNSTYTYSIT